MKKRIIMILMITLTCTMMVMAGGQKDDEGASVDGKIELTYFTYSAHPDHMNDLEEMIAIFENENKDITIKVENAPYADYFTKLQTLVAGGVAPDVFELNYESFVTYAASGSLYDLSSLASNDSSFDSGIFYPKALDAFQYEGSIYGLPETFSTVVLYYNKDLFDKAGLAYPSEDWTWADAVAAGKKINDPANDIWGLFSPIQFWEFYKKVAQNGGAILSADGKTSTLNTPDNVEALETMVDMVLGSGVMPSAADLGGVSNEDFFKSGNLGMVVSGIWMFGGFADAEFNWDIEVEPGMSTKATHFFANALAVSANTKKAEAAWKWAKFFSSSKEVAEMRVATGWELPTLTDESYFKAYLDRDLPENRQAVFNSLKYSIVPPVIERQNELQDAIGMQLDQAALGTITPAQALENAEAAIIPLLK
ncbi:MAG: sugar ABC transporter substrate-binding protein [Spirochaetales bacterium]|nr:sugar ABC transporter substrate-binding protein [Spirochaetales bacterium]